jgi:hypothetical protein
MRELLEKASPMMKFAGYRKERTRFWKVESGVYKLIDFQAGAHGRYFFVNICIHPVGLPELQTGELSIPDRPKEYECILRQRIDQIVLNEATEQFRKGLVSADDAGAVEKVLACLPTHVEPWLAHWGSLARLAHARQADLEGMLTVVPVLKTKACAMLKLFCSIKAGEVEEEGRLLGQYLAASSAGSDFGNVDKYLCSLLRA